MLHDDDDPSDDLVAAAGDRRLLEAWTELGLSTFDPNSTPSTEDRSDPPADA